MKLHEYQAKALLSQYGVAVPRGRVARTPEEAEAIARELGGRTVVKAQAHTGARGRAGGIRIAETPEEAREHTAAMIGMTLVTHQTGPQGLPVAAVLVEEAIEIEREIYLSVAIDNSPGMPIVIASPEGGMEIEEVAARDPEAILKQPFDVGHGLQGYQARALAFGLGLEGDAFKAFVAMAGSVARMFVERDCSLLEINPLVITKQGALVALDGKMGIDDRALELKKQPELEAMRDVHEEDPDEHEASSYGLNYVFNSALDEAKLEQTIKGYDITGAGKRVDALLKTHGLISALSFGEIKTHRAELLKRVSVPYRRECWQISDELAGGIAQVQRSVQASISTIRSKTEIKDGSGTPTGEDVFLYQPRSFLVIGSLAEFQTPRGINEEKYSSFELFRRHTSAPDIITFDELYERARFIVSAVGEHAKNA